MSTSGSTGGFTSNTSLIVTVVLIAVVVLVIKVTLVYWSFGRKYLRQRKEQKEEQAEFELGLRRRAEGGRMGYEGHGQQEDIEVP